MHLAAPVIQSGCRLRVPQKLREDWLNKRRYKKKGLAPLGYILWWGIGGTTPPTHGGTGNRFQDLPVRLAIVDM